MFSSCDGDEDDNNSNDVPMEVDAPQPTNRYKDKKSDRKQRDQPDKPKTTSLLSFDDEGIQALKSIFLLPKLYSNWISYRWRGDVPSEKIVA